MCHGDIDFEAYEIGRAYQIFKLVSLSAKEATILAFVRNFCVWKKPGNESGEFLRGAQAAQRVVDSLAVDSGIAAERLLLRTLASRS